MLKPVRRCAIIQRRRRANPLEHILNTIFVFVAVSRDSLTIFFLLIYSIRCEFFSAYFLCVRKSSAKPLHLIYFFCSHFLCFELLFCSDTNICIIICSVGWVKEGMDEKQVVSDQVRSHFDWLIEISRCLRMTSTVHSWWSTSNSKWTWASDYTRSIPVSMSSCTAGGRILNSIFHRSLPLIRYNFHINWMQFNWIILRFIVRSSNFDV